MSWRYGDGDRLPSFGAATAATVHQPWRPAGIPPVGRHPRGPCLRDPACEPPSANPAHANPRPRTLPAGTPGARLAGARTPAPAPASAQTHAGLPHRRRCGRPGDLLDQAEDGEDRHVEGDDHRPDDPAEHGDHQRLDQAGQRLRRRLDLVRRRSRRSCAAWCPWRRCPHRPRASAPPSAGRPCARPAARRATPRGARSPPPPWRRRAITMFPLVSPTISRLCRIGTPECSIVPRLRVNREIATFWNSLPEDRHLELERVDDPADPLRVPDPVPHHDRADDQHDQRGPARPAFSASDRNTRTRVGAGSVAAEARRTSSRRSAR